MPDYTTETRTFIGQPGMLAFDGWSGFTIGQSYQLRYERRPDTLIAIERDHQSVVAGTPPLLVSRAQFER